MEINKNYDLKEIVYLCEQDNVWKTEVFKDVPGYEGLYQVSDLGRVKSFKMKNTKILVNKIDTKGYQNCCFSKEGCKKYIRVGQMVAMTFLGHKPDGTQKYVVDHKNRIRKDDRLLNLQIITQRENTTKDNPNSNGFVGVTKTKSKRFIAKIRIKGIVTHIGTYDTAEEASKNYLNKLNEITK